MARVEAMNWVFMAGASSKADADAFECGTRARTEKTLRARTMRRCSRAMSASQIVFGRRSSTPALCLLSAQLMKTFVLIMMTALALGGCASQADEETVEEQSEALKNVGGTGGTDSPESCLAAQQACYKTCGSNSSCFRYCDIVYTKCRGLPSPELSMQ